ncbi:hypothetical protein E2R59_15740 [Kocuria rosea]|uniref:Uncharacterized protein n=1 Tax=Kocuria rosea TaxID=1275 RepID=A0A4R5Y8Y9_KOCRO|nr:hypothetical protein E2R59_15740 [Kocuria rosea]
MDAEGVVVGHAVLPGRVGLVVGEVLVRQRPGHGRRGGPGGRRRGRRGRLRRLRGAGGPGRRGGRGAGRRVGLVGPAAVGGGAPGDQGQGQGDQSQSPDGRLLVDVLRGVR